MPFVREGSRLVLSQEGGRASCLFVPTFAVGIGLTLVGGKNVLQTLEIVRGHVALGPWSSAVVFVVGAMLMFVAAVAALGRTRVVIDEDARTVETELRVLFTLRGRRHAFSDLDRVEISRGTGRRSAGHGPALTYHCAVLRGARVAVPLERMSLREARAQAQEVAQWIGVPVVASRAS